MFAVFASVFLVVSSSLIDIFIFSIILFFSLQSIFFETTIIQQLKWETTHLLRGTQQLQRLHPLLILQRNLQQHQCHPRHPVVQLQQLKISLTLQQELLLQEQHLVQALSRWLGNLVINDFT